MRSPAARASSDAGLKLAAGARAEAEARAHAEAEGAPGTELEVPEPDGWDNDPAFQASQDLGVEHLYLRTDVELRTRAGER
eukprot:9072696-Alexandrium_andersonii.AAC.1